jgi:cbb3-type cytochrome oxidase maturation protein
MHNQKDAKMYFPYFIAYIGIGLVLSLPVFFWALKSGQFQDQQRARYLPLRDNNPGAPAKASRLGRWEALTLFFLAVAGLTASAAALVKAVFFH